MDYNDDNTIKQIKKLIQGDKYFFYTHCLIEAKKDGISPEDILYCLLTGKIIESYPERKRLLVYGVVNHSIRLHAVVDLSQDDVLIIVTCYIPDEKIWLRDQKRKR